MLALALGVVGIVIASVNSEREPDGEGVVYFSWYGPVSMAGGIAFTVLGGIGFGIWTQERDLRLNPDSRQQRIQELTSALQRSMGTLEMIKREIEDGNALLDELENRAKVTQELSRLDDRQVIAVTEQIRAELRAEGRRGLLRDVLLGIIWFGLGVVVALLLG